MRGKGNKKDKDIILTRLIDDFFERKRAGGKPTIDEYIKKYPEYADEIKKELEEELFWSSTSNKINKLLKITPTNKELQKGWERVLEKITADPHGNKKETISTKIVFFWDKLHDKFTQIAPKITEAIIPKKPEFQTARKSHDTSQTFPYITAIKSNKDEIVLEINRPGKNDYLALKTLFHFKTKKNLTNVWARLYKGDRIYSSVNLDENGGAFFPRIEEGEYILKFFEKEDLLEKIEISIIIEKNGH